MNPGPAPCAVSASVNGPAQTVDRLRIATARAASVVGAAWNAAIGFGHGRELARLRQQVASQSRQLETSAALRRALRSAPSSRALSRAVLHVLGDTSGARASAFYLAHGGQVLELAAQAGSGWPVDPLPQLRLGEGLAGRAAAGRRRLVDSAPPAGTCVAVPYHLAGRLKGVAVFLFAAAPAAEALELLADTAEPVAMALDARWSRERVQLLLGETRRQTAAFAAQQRILQGANVRLQRSDRYKNEFLANMTHELRSPLNSMLLLSQVLAENRHGRLAPEEVDAAQVINKAGRELLVIIDDILDLTKAEAGRLELHPEPVCLADLAESLKALYLPLAQRRGLEIQVTIEPGTPTECLTDPTRLSQILKNLLNNALKFTEKGGVSLRIAAAPQILGGSPAVEFVVCDTGIGISPEVLPALFAPFTQGDGSISRRFGGSGLGLSICRKLAELLGARIEVASEVGRGSTFRLRLPVRPPAPAAVAPAAVPGGARPVDAPVSPPSLTPGAAANAARAPAAAGTALTGRTVLVVDGDMRSAFRLSGVIESHGGRVRVARDPASGLAAIEAIPAPDLVLVRPQSLQSMAEDGQRQWWEAAAAARLVVIASMIPASVIVPPSLPVLDPDLPADRLGTILAGLVGAHAVGPRRTPEVAPC
ncbi:MAG: hypothetical protein IPK64_06935 [bacterium]|nr:hypothetical protein [bacterium]